MRPSQVPCRRRARGYRHLPLSVLPARCRGFCATCGTTLSYEGPLIDGLIDITIASFDHPAELPPGIHIWDRHRLPWIPPADRAAIFEELPEGAPG